MNARPFFVTGLPRSRTCWLANWLTAGRSHCFHDLTGDCDEVADMTRHFKDVEAGKNYVGDSDSGLTFVWREVHALFPEARWLVVDRDTDEACKSYMDYFSARPYRCTVTPTPEQAATVFSDLRDDLEELCAGLPAGLVMRVGFENLNSMNEASRIWRFLLPGQEFDVDRWVLLDVMEMNPCPEKIIWDGARLGRLAKQGATC